MKRYAFAAAAAAAMVVSAPAMAATTVSFDGESGSYGHDNISAPFDDSFQFVLDAAGNLSVDITSTAVRDRLGNLVRDITFSSVELSGGSLVSPISFDIDETGRRESRSLLDLVVGAGTYTIRAAGTVSGAPGAYTGTISFVAGVVPEPATWALMILGMGMVGGAMRRRNVKTSVRFA